MTILRQIELNWIMSFQGDASWKQLMIWLSYLGAEAIPCVLAAVCFCVAQRKGAQLCLLFWFSSYVMESAKIAFHSPRPYWLDTRVQPWSRAANYGLPSGHAMAAAVVWPFAAKSFNSLWARVAALSIVLLVSASRVYLGAHFISDVVGAWVLAALVVWGFAFLESRLGPRLNSMGSWPQLGVGVWAASALFALGLAASWSIEGSVDPQPWAAFSRQARNLTGLVYSSGSLLGAACGIVMAMRWARYRPAVGWSNRVACVVYALAGMWLIRESLGAVPAHRAESLRWALELCKGAAPNCWLLFLAPWILLKVGLLKNAFTAESADAPAN